MKFIETSAKTSQNVEESFRVMTKEIIDIMVEKEKSMTKKTDDKNSKVDLNKKSTKLIDKDQK